MTDSSTALVRRVMSWLAFVWLVAIPSTATVGHGPALVEPPVGAVVDDANAPTSCPRRPPLARARGPPPGPKLSETTAAKPRHSSTRSRPELEDHHRSPTTASPHTSANPREQRHAENDRTHDKPKVKQLTYAPLPDEEIR